MDQQPGGIFGVVKRTVRDFLDDDCMSAAAALSYYTVFSLPAVLVLLLLVLGAVLDPEDVRGGLERQLQMLMGPSAGGSVRTILSHAEQPGGGLLPTLLGVGALLFGATGALLQLQSALNRAWEVESKAGGLKAFLGKRVFSLGILMAIAFFLLVSLAVSAALSAVGNRIGRYLPDGMSSAVLFAINIVISLAVIGLLFAVMFKVLPDAKTAWRDVWVGAGVTALLFMAGKFLIGFYLGKSNPGEAYGAAGSLAVLLLWIYYSSIIVLIGAEFTQAWASARGKGIEPEEGAIRVKREKRVVRSTEPRHA
ncbi:MAG TPA: YihY/virulence factor BrkB family protein [Gemmatimonadales bacterium]|nr:YihY/virulence factor BrkB family protein [Gemmatimonadales bacterium]